MTFVLTVYIFVQYVWALMVRKTFLINTCDVWVQTALPLKKIIRSIGMSRCSFFLRRCNLAFPDSSSRYRAFPSTIHDGLPSVDSRLQWLPGSPTASPRLLHPLAWGYRESCWHGSRSVTTPPLSLAQPSLALSFSQRRHRFAVLFEKI